MFEMMLEKPQEETVGEWWIFSHKEFHYINLWVTLSWVDWKLTHIQHRQENGTCHVHIESLMVRNLIPVSNNILDIAFESGLVLDKVHSFCEISRVIRNL